MRVADARTALADFTAHELADTLTPDMVAAAKEAVTVVWRARQASKVGALRTSQGTRYR